MAPEGGRRYTQAEFDFDAAAAQARAQKAAARVNNILSVKAKETPHGDTETGRTTALLEAQQDERDDNNPYSTG